MTISLEEDSNLFAIEALLEGKILSPLTSDMIGRLENIKRLVPNDAWTEADVRANIIDPIIRLLGYQKGDVFSVDRERKLEFLDTRVFIDYSFTLWSENFWLIEAKRPNTKRTRFSQKDLEQALRYAVHPEINAAIIVLSDGSIFEIFDRELDVSKPLLRILRTELCEKFDALRAVLEPWQIWFFQKRRIVKLVDKVFDKEFNFNRVAEFRDIIEKGLNSKRMKILQNYRDNIDIQAEANLRNDLLKKASIEELIEIHLFYDQNYRDLLVITNSLVSVALDNPFKVLYKIFPDNIRDSSSTFWAQSLFVLMRMEEREVSPNWLPDFLRGGPTETRSLAAAIRRLIDLCLSFFTTDEDRKIVLLFSSSIRRLLKIMSVIDVKADFASHLHHLLFRFMSEERSFEQILSSPGRHILHRLDALTIDATSNFVRVCHDDRNNFLTEIARQRLQQLWESEIRLLDSVPRYTELLVQKAFGELRMTEASCVSWDALAHNSLVFIDHYPKWRNYVIDKHNETINKLSSMGYWSARRICGIPISDPTHEIDTAWASSRFFFGNNQIAQNLRSAYASHTEADADGKI